MIDLPRSHSLPHPISSFPSPNSARPLGSSESQCAPSELDHKTNAFLPSYNLPGRRVKLDPGKDPLYSSVPASSSISRKMSDSLYRRITTSVSASADLNKHAEQLRKARMEEVQTAAHRRKQTGRLRSIPSENSTPDKAESLFDPLSDLPANPTTWSPRELALYLAHVLNLGPARLIADIRSYVIGAGMGGRQFLKMTAKQFQQTGLNRKWVKMMSVARNNLRQECRRNRTGLPETEWKDDNVSPQRKSNLPERPRFSAPVSTGQVADMAKYFEDEELKTSRNSTSDGGGVVDSPENRFSGGSCDTRSMFDLALLASKAAPGLPSAQDSVSRQSRRCSVASSNESFYSVLSTDEIDLNSIALIRPALIRDSLLEADQSAEWDESSVITRSPSPLGINERIINSPFNSILADHNDSDSKRDARGSTITIKASRSVPMNFEIKSSSYIPSTSLAAEEQGPSSTLTVKPYRSSSFAPPSTLEHPCATKFAVSSPPIDPTKLSPLQNRYHGIKASPFHYSDLEEKDKRDQIEEPNDPQGNDLQEECALIKELLAHTGELLNTPQRKNILEQERHPTTSGSEDLCDDSLLVSASKLKAMERQMFEIEHRLKRSKSREFSIASGDVSISCKSDVITDDPSSWSELGGYLFMATLGLGIVAGRVIVSKALGWRKT